MSEFYETPFGGAHDHAFLGVGHERNNKRKTRAAIALLRRFDYLSHSAVEVHATSEASAWR
ncbi:hypothetical protein QU481_00870 [Crenobacter sp. SG2303]|uniref:Uncharacterized protein n=1 Tax=Crenobacter oryzisoli TaxID=3056844 RepID=A0ABT7XI47_9NEIS|nr:MULTISPECIES: hypothetical protein [unclassified Crenobacter]MDN0073452.1 hypothetical protein [Crenobacter sp. SG2303]MDN0083368.1 hypothetical protein [Crenobacter sp. SG2305]